MQERELKISVHERRDVPGYIVTIDLRDRDKTIRSAMYPTNTFPEAVALAESIANAGEKVIDALLPGKEEGSP